MLQVKTKSFLNRITDILNNADDIKVKQNRQEENNCVNIVEKKERSKIKIIFGITLSETGGAQRVVYDIISALPPSRYDITLVTSEGGELINLVNNLNLNRKSPIKIITINYLKRDISPIYDLKTLCKLYRILKKGKFDIAHFHSSKMGILGRIAARLSGTKKIYFTVHGWGISDDMSHIKQKILGAAERLCGRICTKVICVSEHDRRKGIKNKYAKENKFCVIHNGIENRYPKYGILRREFKIPGYIPIVGSVMRLKEPKQPQFMINVAKELLNRGKKIKFFIIGGGPLFDECKELIEKNGIQSEVILTGERIDARDLVSDFDVLTLFSKSEGFPISILEGMLCSLPVVASKVGGISEIIRDGFNGYLLDTLDIKKAADLIEKLINTSEGLMMGLNGKNKVLTEFTKEKMIREYEKLYIGEVNIKKKIIEEAALQPKTLPSENEYKPITKNFSWILMGNTSYAISKGLLLMLIAKFGNVEMVGQFSLALAITNPVFMLTNLRLRLVLSTDNERKYAFINYFSLRILASAAGVFICTVVSLFFRSSFEQFLVLFLMAFARLFESLSDIAFGRLENKENMDTVGKSMMLKAIGTTVMMGLPFFLTRNLAAGTAGLASAFLVLFIFYDYRKIRNSLESRKKIEYKVLWNLVRVSLPLGILQGLVSLNGNIPLFFIRGYLGTTALGYYSSIVYLTTIGETVNIAIGQSVTPRLSKYYANDEKGIYLKTLFKTVAASTLLGAFGLIVTAGGGKMILSMLYTRDYAGYWSIFMLQMVASSSNYIGGALSNSITAARKFKIQPFLYCGVMIINAIFMMLLVPSDGLEGASYALIISSYIHFAANLFANIFLVWK